MTQVERAWVPHLLAAMFTFLLFLFFILFNLVLCDRSSVWQSALIVLLRVISVLVKGSVLSGTNAVSH